MLLPMMLAVMVVVVMVRSSRWVLVLVLVRVLAVLAGGPALFRVREQQMRWAPTRAFTGVRLEQRLACG